MRLDAFVVSISPAFLAASLLAPLFACAGSDNSTTMADSGSEDGGQGTDADSGSKADASADGGHSTQDGGTSQKCAAETFDDDQDPDTACVPHTQCATGEFVIEEGTATRDRRCEPCESGSFSATLNAQRCQQWTACASPAVVVVEGTVTSDSVCRLMYRASVAHETGEAADNVSLGPDVASGGRYVAFSSYGTNLVTNDTNGAQDVFVHDTQAGTTVRVSVDSAGIESNAEAVDASISADGRYVVFSSGATNLVDDDTNGFGDIFRHDLETGETHRVSLTNEEAEADGHCLRPTLSDDGRYVAFESHASNLVAGDTNGVVDVFVRDMEQGTTRRVSVSSEGEEASLPSEYGRISGDGRYVAFESEAPDLVEGDSNAVEDIFVHDLAAETTTRVSVSSDGAQADAAAVHASVASGGRYVVFNSGATTLVEGDTNDVDDVFLHDMETRVTTRLSVSSSGEQGNSGSLHPRVSADGRTVAFESSADNFAEDDSNRGRDVFLYDIQQGTTVRLSVNLRGEGGNGESYEPRIAPDGYVAFTSVASNLVAGDGIHTQDVFVTDSPL